LVKRALVVVKLLHTIIWAFFAACIVALPVVALERRFDWAVGLTVLVLTECLVLALNGMRCPLTDLAAKYTSDRSDNFDMYLPRQLARYNKAIFGTLFVCGEIVVVWCRVRSGG